MVGEPKISRRNAEVLHWIVREYIATGEPVGSLTISRRRHGAMSPATIRNAMASLAEEGYVSQPHTSAGRVPTEKAFRAFVQDMIVHRPSSVELERLNEGFSGVESVEEGVERSSRLLTEWTHNMGIAAAIPAVSQTLDHVELLPLADRRVLAIVVTGDGVVRNRVVTLDDAVSADELISIRNYLNQHFSGWVLADVRDELERRLELQNAYYDALLKRLTALYARGILDIELAPSIHMGGASYLVALDLHVTRERTRELLQELEQKKRILQLLDRFLEAPPGEVKVQVGLGDLHPAMGELSLIGITVLTPGGMTAKVAVLGPMRMHYERVIATVLGVGRTLQNLPS